MAIGTGEVHRAELGLVHGSRPDFGFPGAWLYDRDKPAIHLNEAVGTPSASSNAFDHVAFYTEDLNSALARLDAMKVHYYGLRPIPESSFRQCFLERFAFRWNRKPLPQIFVRSIFGRRAGTHFA